jgi:hypothetical protein
MNHTSDILYAIGIAASVAFLVAPFLPRTRACSTQHHRIALLFVGLSGFVWATLGLLDVPLHPHLSRTPHFLLHRCKVLCSGAGLSIILLQFVSGEFASAHRRDKQLRQQSLNENPTKVA